MSKDKPKRPRVKPEQVILTDAGILKEIDVVVDDSAYRENACSPNAKFISTFIDTFKIEFWIDIHYADRSLERDGISLETIHDLVLKAFIHFHYYSSKHNFTFINHPPKKTRGIRVVVQKEYPKSEKLNVVVEYHFLKLNTLEVTVVTAICSNNYYYFDNQYGIEFHEDATILYLNKNKTLQALDDYTE